MGKGSANITNLDAVDPADIVALYQNSDFMPSTNIGGIEQFLDLSNGTPAKKKAAAKKVVPEKTAAKKAAPKKKEVVKK